MSDVSNAEEKLAVLLHELRGPLVNSRNASALIRKLLDAKNTDIRKIYLLLDDIEHTMNLSLSMLEGSRFASVSQLTELKIERIPIQVLTDCVKRVMHMVHANSRSNDSRAIYRGLSAESLEWVVGDRRAIEICLANLAMNATKFSVRGRDIIFEVSLFAELGVVSIRNFVAANDAHQVERWRSLGYSTGNSAGYGLAIVSEICAKTGMDLAYNVVPALNEKEMIVTAKLSIPRKIDEKDYSD